MDVKVSKPEPDPRPEPHHIYLRSGQVVSVMAYSFRVHINKQTISFYSSETDRNKKIFWQLPEVSGVVASSALAELPPLVNLQTQVEALTVRMNAFETSFAARMDALEANIGETIARAVRAGISSKS
jgi:hypothetical protein